MILPMKLKCIKLMGLQKVRPNFLAPLKELHYLGFLLQGQFHFESYLPNFEDIGLFIAPRESGGGREVWVTDGTIDGTYQLTDIYPDGNALPDDGHIAGGHLFFSALDSEHGEELRIIRNFTDFTPYKPSYTVYTNDEMDPITFNYDESLFQGSIENPTWTTANGRFFGYILHHLTSQTLMAMEIWISYQE